MDNKYIIKQGYDVNFNSARECLKRNNVTEAKRLFQRALEYAIKLCEMSFGSEREGYLVNARNIKAYIEKIDEKLQSVHVPQPMTAQASAANASQRSAAAPAQNAPQAQQAQTPVEKPSVDEALNELFALEGLQSVKTKVTSFIAMVKNRQERLENNLPVPPFSYHMIFTGNPGTGKTTVARIMAKIFCALGICEKPEVVEVVASDLVAEHVGGTANKTREVLERAIGGVLFLDEAYRLVEEGTKNFGQEAIGEILTAMENNRDSLIVIAAGYEDDMDTFVRANDGLPSRFKTTLNFADYNGEEMFRIFMKMCEKNQFVLTPQASEMIQQMLMELYANRDEKFANARDVRNRFEMIYANQATRLAMTEHTAEDLSIFDVADVQGIK